jgi:predicted glutamine amidotransferase
MLSDGEFLFCYRDAEAYKHLTWRYVGVHGDRPHRFEDRELQIALEDPQSNHGVLVASNPLSSAGWESLRPGELLVLHAGAIQFSSHTEAGAPLSRTAQAASAHAISSPSMEQDG